jgi:hypothetical protein
MIIETETENGKRNGKWKTENVRQKRKWKKEDENGNVKKVK